MAAILECSAMKTVSLLALGLLLSSSLGCAQNAKVPPFSGTWILNMQRSKVEAAHPPISSEAEILYDGKTWHFKRRHKNGSGKVDTWSIDLVVGSREFHVEKDGPLVFHSRMYRDGDARVLVEDITAPGRPEGEEHRSLHPRRQWKHADRIREGREARWKRDESMGSGAKEELSDGP
jgi:hypothetical protein